MKRYELGPNIDLDAEEVYEPDGTRLTEQRAQQIAETHGVTADGTPVTDAMVEEMADKAEAGYDVDEILKRRHTDGDIERAAARFRWIADELTD